MAARATNYNRLCQMTKEAEATCAHLLANAKVVEGQLKALRTEHEVLRAEANALRRCLDKSGVLPSAELDEELKRSGLPGGPAMRDTPVSAPMKTPTTPKTPVTPTPVSPPERASTGSIQRLTRQSRSPRRELRGRSPPPVEAPPQVSDLPSVPLEVEPVVVSPPKSSSCEFQTVFQAVLEEGSPTAEQHALRSLQNLLRIDPGAFHEFVDPQSPTSSALSTAVRGNKMDAVKILLKARADPNERDDKGVSALHLAAFDGNLDLCKTLTLARADVDACDRHGQTPLFFAPNKDVCKLLIERKSDVNVLNRRGQSALHMAGRAGLHEVLAWLSSRVSQTLCELKDVHGINAKTYAKMSGVPLPIPSPIPVRSTRTPSPTHSIQSNQSKGRLNRNSPRSGSLKSLGSVRDGRNSPAAASAKSLPSVPTAHAFDFFEVANSPSNSPPKKGAGSSPTTPAVFSTSPEATPQEQLPSMSTLVGDYSEQSLESMYAGLDSLEKLQKMRGRAQTMDRGDTVAALAAAAAVATAAVTTAAELTPRTTSGVAPSRAISGDTKMTLASPESKGMKPEKVAQVDPPELRAEELADLGIMEAEAEDLSHLGIVDDEEGLQAFAGEDLAAAGIIDDQANPLAPLDGELDECW